MVEVLSTKWLRHLQRNGWGTFDEMVETHSTKWLWLPSMKLLEVLSTKWLRYLQCKITLIFFSSTAHLMRNPASCGARFSKKVVHTSCGLYSNNFIIITIILLNNSFIDYITCRHFPLKGIYEHTHTQSQTHTHTYAHTHSPKKDFREISNDTKKD